MVHMTLFQRRAPVLGLSWLCTSETILVPLDTFSTIEVRPDYLNLTKINLNPGLRSPQG